jgi:MerR family mercuric resistance operon transcriptional regulator
MKTRISVKNDDLLTIGELARLSAVHIETIRFYQRRGLLAKPVRPSTGIRHYGEQDIARI